MPRMAWLALGGAAFAGLGCAETASPKPQLVIVMDTDLPAPLQVLDHPELSLDAAVDTVRVEAIPTDGTTVPYDLNTFLASRADDWPISFGVETDLLSAGSSVRLRIRAFAGVFSAPGEINGKSTLDPESSVTIDRIVDIPAPTDGVRTVAIHLSGDCIGVAGNFIGDPTTCIDKNQLSAKITEGIEDTTDTTTTVVGTWPGSLEVPCSVAAKPGTKCIPGGYSVLGDVAFRGIKSNGRLDSYPPQPVLVSPVFMDETEFTVGALHTLIDSGKYTGQRPGTTTSGDAFASYCLWTDTPDPTKADLPLNCVSVEVAEEVCRAAGGRLAREAEWEHAARGRGRRYIYPWGNEPPTCCAASVSRPDLTEFVECTTMGKGIEAVGSHQPSAACGGIGDRSLDGVLDMAGSMEEIMADRNADYGTECWTRTGVLRDPVCTVGGASNMARGGQWSGGIANVASAFRYTASADSRFGFRCVYQDPAHPTPEPTP